MRILVTGTAGFIGFHLAKRLLDRGDEVYGADNLNNYYDVRLKHARLAQLEGRPGFTFQKLDLADRNAVPELFQRIRPQHDLMRDVGFKPSTRIEEGVHRFVDWYRSYYGRTSAPSSVLCRPTSVARPLSSVVRPTEALKNRALSRRKAR